MEIHVSIEGADQLYKRLGIDVVPIIAPAIDRSGYRVEAALKVYPAPPAGSAYRRTGQYGGGWQTTTATAPMRVIAKTYNPTEYAGWVGSAEQQARVHRGRWLTDIQALEKEVQPVTADVTGLINSAYTR